MKRSLLALGLSLFMIFNTASLYVSAGEIAPVVEDVYEESTEPVINEEIGEEIVEESASTDIDEEGYAGSDEDFEKKESGYSIEGEMETELLDATYGSYVWPVPSVAVGKITSGRGYSSSHKGIDIPAVMGATMVACKSGTVKIVYRGCNNHSGIVNGNCTARGLCSPNHGTYQQGDGKQYCNFGFGNGIVVQADDGTWWSYAHMSRVDVSEGQRVTAGQTVGAAGDAGYSNGVHCHFATATSATISSGYYANMTTFDPLTQVYTTNKEPRGTVDLIQSTYGEIFVKGWAYDPDTANTPIWIHVYIGGGPGDPNGQCYATEANISRPDLVTNVGINAEHGFAFSFWTDKTGNLPYYVYALDSQGGNNPLIGSGTITVTPDTEKPRITTVSRHNITKNGYTVSCTVSDNDQVLKVMFPTWTANNWQDDLAPNWWDNPAVMGRKEGNQWVFDMKVSDHNNEYGDYITHIYVYDRSLNYSCHELAPCTLVNDSTPPVISNVKISNVDATGYTVSCKVTDNDMVSYVDFPTWTLKNGQDDLKNPWGNNYRGVKNGDTYTFRVNISDHNNELGEYVTHIYAHDRYKANTACYQITTPIVVKSASSNTGSSSTKKFVDVVKGSFYENAVDWAVAKGVTTGTSPTTFSPDDACKRGQVVAFLWRAYGCPEPSRASSPFTDVQDKGKYYYKAVLWAVEKGITTGTSPTTFSPEDTVTRGQFVSFLYRSKGNPAASGSCKFTDVPSGKYYYKPIIWAAKTGVTTGTSPTTFSPENPCTRAQVVTFIYRAMK